MFSILISDDNYEDRELLKSEIELALGSLKTQITFYEAPSVKKTLELLRTHPFDLLTLDIEFDRLNEGLSVLPEIFEEYPTLNILIISGRLDKSEVAEQLFRFTKDNVLKGKRWIRHFDVLDKKDHKSDTLIRVFQLATKKQNVADSIRELFRLAESYLDKEEYDKCLEVYQKIQTISPGEIESDENINIIKGKLSPEHILQYMRKGEKVVASLLLGHYLERRLKLFTRKMIGHYSNGLYGCLKELENSRRFSPYKKSLFQKILNLRNKAIHSPTAISEDDFYTALKHLRVLEARF